MQNITYYHLRKIYQASSLKKRMFTDTQVKHKEMKHNLLVQSLYFFPSVQYLCKLQDLGWEA